MSSFCFRPNVTFRVAIEGDKQFPVKLSYNDTGHYTVKLIAENRVSRTNLSAAIPVKELPVFLFIFFIS